VMDLLNGVIVIIIMILRLYCWGGLDSTVLHTTCDEVTVVLPRTLYALTSILICMRVMPYLRYYKSVGVLTIVLGSMMKDVKLFFIILMIVSGGFAMAFAILIPGHMNSPWYFILSSSPFWKPFWGVFGDFDLDDYEEYLAHEMPTRTVVPLLLWIYMFFATIVLVNLLIAQMSETFNQVNTKGAVRWKFERALLILEFKDTKLPAPPPLNLIWLLLVVIPLRIYNRCAGIVRADVRGYKLIPKQEEVQKIQRKEQGFIRKYLVDKRRKDGQAFVAKIDALQDYVSRGEARNESRFETINGKVDLMSLALADKFAALHDSLGKSPRQSSANLLKRLDPQVE